jgi:APA family basic amino acid/polyamine antiporter
VAQKNGGLIEPPNVTTPGQLHRVIGGLDGLAIVIGIVIGAGILATPGLIAGHIRHPTILLLLWTLGGVSALCTALVLAELGAMIPAAGGKYVFVKRAYGNVAGCFAGWGEVLLNRSFTGSLKAVLIAQYTMMLLGGRGSKPVIAGAVTILFLWLHLRGVRIGKTAQNLMTLLKVVVLIAIIAAGLLLGDGVGWRSIEAPPQGLLLGLAVTAQSVFFTYYGAEASLQMSEELKNPGRDVPRMLLFGIGSIALLYLLINSAFLNTLTSAQMGASGMVARDVLASTIGEAAGVAVAVAALLILLSSFNYNFLGTPRVPYGLARDGLAPQAFLRVNAGGTPTIGLWLTAFFIFVLAVTSTFELLLRFMSFMALIVDGLVLTTLFVLRRREPDLHRPFRVPWYPFVPVLALLFYTTILLIITVTQPKLAAGGAAVLFVVALGSSLLVRHNRKQGMIKS